jgi:NAD(P)H-hydrate epimerase
MLALPTLIHSVAQVRAMDAHAIARGIPAYTLMTRAAEAALTALRSEWPLARRVLVVCGYGNNAGDGYVLARLAIAAKLQVSAVAVGDPEQLQGTARQAWQDYIAIGGLVHSWHADLLLDAEVIVDALLGTGLSRPLDQQLQTIVQSINDSARPVLALDVPTGLNADTGAIMGRAICAHHTITFVGLKQGLYLGCGPNQVGTILFDDLGISADVVQHAVATRLDISIVTVALPRRSRTAHKGQQGHVLIIGGGLGMPGAARLSGEASLRVGAGLVTIATRPEHVSALIAGRPELMCRGVMSAADLEPLLQSATVIAIGPGLGQDEWANSLFTSVLATDKPLVVDADALNLLARRRCTRSNWVLTPHPGEAARLLGTSTGLIQSARLQALQELLGYFSGTVVLKGAGTLVGTTGQLPALCDRGNPGMAVPGMGDVLTGIIAGIAAQQINLGNDLSLAARAGVYAHAVAGDMAARHGERGLLASDLFRYLPRCVNP